MYDSYKYMLPTPVFMPRKSHGQRSLVGYSPWGHKELDTTNRLTHTHTHTHTTAIISATHLTRACIVVAVVQSLGRGQLFVTPCTAAHQYLQYLLEFPQTHAR